MLRDVDGRPYGIGDEVIYPKTGAHGIVRETKVRNGVRYVVAGGGDGTWTAPARSVARLVATTPTKRTERLIALKRSHGKKKS